MAASKEPKTLGERLAWLRGKRGWTVSFLSTESGVSTPVISRIENEKSVRPSADVISSLADALRSTTDYLLHGKGARWRRGYEPPENVTSTDRRRREHRAEKSAHDSGEIPAVKEATLDTSGRVPKLTHQDVIAARNAHRRAR